MRLREATAPITAALALQALLACGGAPPPLAPTVLPSPSPTPFTGPPNVVLILADDLGYGDLSCFGAPTIRTPHIDGLASEGARLVDLRVPSALCTPSRGALLTGLYPPMTGLMGNLPSGSPTDGISEGIDDDETTLAEALRARGYSTHMVGKWHLGSNIPHLPTRHGFDSYLGISNGVQTTLLLRDTTPVANPPGIDQLTRLYTEEAVRIVRTARAPFFLFLAHRSPHVPLEPAPEFRGRSAGGLYGDVVEEMDWSVGEVVRAIREGGLDRSTLVIFLSDNGPAIGEGAEGGSPAPFRGGKNSPLEGGMRVPAIVWWPGRIPAGQTISEPLMSLDVFPTVVTLAGGALPSERRYFGADVMPVLSGAATRLPLVGKGIGGAREMLGYYFLDPVTIRSGRWKYMLPGFWDFFPALYDVAADPTESIDHMASDPAVAQMLVRRLPELAEEVGRDAKRPKRGGGGE